MGLNKQTISVKQSDCMQRQRKPHSLKHTSQWLSLFSYVESWDFCYSHCCDEAPTKKQLRGKGFFWFTVWGDTIHHGRHGGFG